MIVYIKHIKDERFNVMQQEMHRARLEPVKKELRSGSFG